MSANISDWNHNALVLYTGTQLYHNTGLVGCRIIAIQ